MRILIVDDNLMQRMLMEHTLKIHNYSVVMASSGKEALQALEDYADVRLVITDMMMPHGNGLELLRQMQSNPRQRNIPVIMCTILSDSENINKAAMLGCRFYVIKPIYKQRFMQTVKEALETSDRLLRGFEASPRIRGLDNASLYLLVLDFEKAINETIVMAKQKTNDSDTDFIRDKLNILYAHAVSLGAEDIVGVLADIQSGFELSAFETEKWQAAIHGLKALSCALPQGGVIPEG